MSTMTEAFRELDARRRKLGMPYRRLAQLSGVSQPAIQRLLSGRIASPSITSVTAVACALGVNNLRILEDGSFRFEPGQTVEQMREQQARRKAGSLVRMVQGTSALEGQAVSGPEYEELLESAFHKLLAGSRRKLWEM